MLRAGNAFAWRTVVSSWRSDSSRKETGEPLPTSILVCATCNPIRVKPTSDPPRRLDWSGCSRLERRRLDCGGRSRKAGDDTAFGQAACICPECFHISWAFDAPRDSRWAPSKAGSPACSVPPNWAGQNKPLPPQSIWGRVGSFLALPKGSSSAEHPTNFGRGSRDNIKNDNMKRLHTLFLPVAASVLLAGCSNPADGVPEAEVKPATATAAESTAAVPANAQAYSFDSETASIDFVGSKVTGSHNGGFKKFVGEFQVVDGKLAKSGHKLVIDTTSLWSDNDRLTGHLKSPDFFGVDTYPTATFTATAVEQAGSEAKVTGRLSLHGVTKEITFPAQVKVTDQAVEVTAEFVLNRFDFDMKYPGKADDLIRKEVVLKLNLKAAPGKADFTTLPATGSAA